jgi:hypothetical protein
MGKLWHQTRCPATDEWIKKVWYIHTMEYYSALKKDGAKTFAGKGMELKIMIWSEISQTQKDKHHMFSLMEKPGLKEKSGLSMNENYLGGGGTSGR